MTTTATVGDWGLTFTPARFIPGEEVYVPYVRATDGRGVAIACIDGFSVRDPGVNGIFPRTVVEAMFAMLDRGRRHVPCH